MAETLTRFDTEFTKDQAGSDAEKIAKVFGEEFLAKDRSGNDLGSLACVLQINTHRDFDGDIDRSWPEQNSQIPIEEITSLN